MFNYFRKRRYQDHEIHPDEVLVDTVNLSNLNRQQFEGVFEKALDTRVIWVISFLFFGVFIFFGYKIFSLQVIQGAEMRQRAEDNRLKQIPLFAERGVIYDRNEKELAWNVRGLDNEPFLLREYIAQSGYGHLLGYVEYPEVDSKGNFWRFDTQGLAGIEKEYNALLQGKNGMYLQEINALGEVQFENTIEKTESGKNIITSIDAELQHRLYEAIRSEAESKKFEGGAGAIMNIHTGELFAFTSYPEFDPRILAKGEDAKAIEGFFTDKQKPFLNRVINGLYTPGSIVKPFLALAALHEGVITEDTKIMSTGRITIPNRFNPSNSSYFRDWKRTGHGITDVKKAIAESVNTFFYAIGGGYQGQKGLGIEKIEYYIRAFDITEPTGIAFGDESRGLIPNPTWKEERFEDGVWRVGDTYNTSIGQFGFQVTPLQMLKATAALANNGTLVTPSLFRGFEPLSKKVADINQQSYFDIIKEGMRQTVTKGTAQNINVKYIDIAAKTGTAQVGKDNEFYNSWIIGFFPYEKPEYAFVIVMEKAPKGGTGSASRAMKTFIESIQEHYPIFFGNQKSN